MYASSEALRKDVQRRLRRGENMVLYGPHGIGKTTVLMDLAARMKAAGIVCARAPETRGLEDIDRALAVAHPPKESSGLSYNPRGRRVWKAEELKASVLLLDHLTHVTKGMVRFMHWLRNGMMGVLTAVDVEVQEEDWRLRPWRLGTLSIRMPNASGELPV